MTKVVALGSVAVAHNTTRISGIVAIDVAHIVTVLYTTVSGDTTHACILAANAGVIGEVRCIVAALNRTIVAVTDNTADVVSLYGAVHTAAANSATLSVCHHTTCILIVVRGSCCRSKIHVLHIDVFNLCTSSDAEQAFIVLEISHGNIAHRMIATVKVATELLFLIAGPISNRLPFVHIGEIHITE